MRSVRVLGLTSGRVPPNTTKTLEIELGSFVFRVIMSKEIVTPQGQPVSPSQMKAGEWIASQLTLGNIITIITIVVGLSIQWATIGVHVTDLERRVGTIESQYVRQHDIDTRLASIENMLRDLWSAERERGSNGGK